MRNNADIVSLEEMAGILNDFRKWAPPTIVMTSGGFAPVHPGHISCFQQSKRRAEFLVLKQTGLLCRATDLIVVVNSDRFLEKKHGRAFMPQDVRCEIVSAIRDVDWVVKFQPSDPEDMTVCEAIERLKPDFFTKGGDRTSDNIPEGPSLDRVGCTAIYNVGDAKKWSSSVYLNSWVANLHGKIKTLEAENSLLQREAWDRWN